MERWLLRSLCRVEIPIRFYCIIALEELSFRNPQSCCRLTGGISMLLYFRPCRSRPALLWLTLFVGRLLQSRYKLILFSSSHPLGWPEVMERWLLCSQCHVEISLCFYCIIALEELPFRNPQSCCRLTGSVDMVWYFRLCRSRPALSGLILFVVRLLPSRYKLILFPSGHPLGWPEVMECWLLHSQCCMDICLYFYSIIALEELSFRNPQSCHRLTGGIVMT